MSLKVKDIMVENVITIGAEVPVRDAVKLMFEHKIKKLPVVKRGHLVGIVSLTDVINSPEITRWLEKLSLEKAPRRIRKIINGHFGINRDQRKRCPLREEYARISINCLERNCTWLLEDECTILKLTREISIFAHR